MSPCVTPSTVWHNSCPIYNLPNMPEMVGILLVFPKWEEVGCGDRAQKEGWLQVWISSIEWVMVTFAAWNNEISMNYKAKAKTGNYTSVVQRLSPASTCLHDADILAKKLTLGQDHFKTQHFSISCSSLHHIFTPFLIHSNNSIKTTITYWNTWKLN